VFIAPAAVWLACATVALNFLAHLVIAHPVALTVYYLESYPAVAFLAALGTTSFLVRTRRRRAGSPIPDPRSRHSIGFVLLLLLFVPALNDLYQYRLRLELYRARKQRFENSISCIPCRAIVFVRYSRLTDSFTSLVENDPDLSKEQVWKVRDLGLDADRRLLRVAPDRAPYIYLVESESLVRLDPDLSNLISGSKP